MTIVLNALSGICALIAAYFWFASSRISWPESATIDDGDANGDGAGMPEVEAWSRKISRANSRGAFAAAASALLMSAATLLPLLVRT